MLFIIIIIKWCVKSLSFNLEKIDYVGGELTYHVNSNKKG